MVENKLCTSCAVVVDSIVSHRARASPIKSILGRNTKQLSSSVGSNPPIRSFASRRTEPNRTEPNRKEERVVAVDRALESRIALEPKRTRARQTLPARTLTSIAWVSSVTLFTHTWTRRRCCAGNPRLE